MKSIPLVKFKINCLIIQFLRVEKVLHCKYILLYGRHSIPLRGHVCACGYKNCANFQAVLDFRFEICDKILKQHFHTAFRNAAYSFKAVQNYLTSCCAEAPIQETVQEIRSDEVKDCLNREQMPVILANVDTGAKTQENSISSCTVTQG